MTLDKQLYDRARVGGDILSFCGRCKMELAHVVIAMVDAKAGRVMCKTCRAEHAHRAGEKTVSNRTRTSTPRVSKTVMLVSELWQKRLDERKNAQPIPYAPVQTFKQGDCINHAKFGLGCVEQVRMAGKILVLFRDGERLLVHSVPPPNAH